LKHAESRSLLQQASTPKKAQAGSCEDLSGVGELFIDFLAGAWPPKPPMKALGLLAELGMQRGGRQAQPSDGEEETFTEV